jgi:AhpD family alkylhydroperoxidase
MFIGNGGFMDNLSLKEISLIGIGASIGSNCIPCVVYHIKQCRNNGISDAQINSAIEIAVKVKNVPYENVLSAALRQLYKTEIKEKCSSDQPCGCS